MVQHEGGGYVIAAFAIVVTGTLRPELLVTVTKRLFQRTVLSYVDILAKSLQEVMSSWGGCCSSDFSRSRRKKDLGFFAGEKKGKTAIYTADKEWGEGQVLLDMDPGSGALRHQLKGAGLRAGIEQDWESKGLRQKAKEPGQGLQGI